MFKKKEPTHVSILGVDIPLATIAYATSTAPVIYAELGEYNVYYSECDRDILKSLNAFEALATRRDGRLPVHKGINRQIFTYGTLDTRTSW